MLVGLLAVAVILAASAYAYMHLPMFGALPEGAQLTRLEQSPHYRDGAFRNLEPIPPVVSGGGMVRALLEYATTKKDRPAPPVPVVSVKTDLTALDREQDVVIWLGHWSLFIQIAGRRILVDPVFSDNAAPIPYANRAFAGTNVYSAGDIPDIDYLLITHDHWDHLDYPTIAALREKTGKVICPLGVGAHFARWQYPAGMIIETDWYDTVQLGDGLAAHALPSRHFSGRGLTRDKSLWSAFALVSPGRKLYLSGDSGYGSHFREAGERFGGFDLAVLDCGQYNEAWRFVHMMPEDAAQAAEDLGADAFLPAHVGKFSIAYHSWDDPFIRLAEASRTRSYRLVTPKLGEPVRMDDAGQRFAPWWEDMAGRNAR